MLFEIRLSFRTAEGRAGIYKQNQWVSLGSTPWIPASAGMTKYTGILVHLISPRENVSAFF